MEKVRLNEEINKMRKLMALNENFEENINESNWDVGGEFVVKNTSTPPKGHEHLKVGDKLRIAKKWKNAAGDVFGTDMSKDNYGLDVDDINKLTSNESDLGEAEEFDLSKVDNPNAYTDDIFDHNAERAEDPFDDGDSTRISMIAMSMLSDIQERAPEMADKINMVKRLIMKMNDKTEISHSELDAIMQGLD
jgi:hypothetical protein